MKDFTNVEKVLFSKGEISTAELNEMGYSAYDINLFMNANLLERKKRGFYVLKEKLNESKKQDDEHVEEKKERFSIKELQKLYIDIFKNSHILINRKNYDFALNVLLYLKDISDVSFINVDLMAAYFYSGKYEEAYELLKSEETFSEGNVCFRIILKLMLSRLCSNEKEIELARKEALNYLKNHYLEEEINSSFDWFFRNIIREKYPNAFANISKYNYFLLKNGKGSFYIKLCRDVCVMLLDKYVPDYVNLKNNRDLEFYKSLIKEVSVAPDFKEEIYKKIDYLDYMMGCEINEEDELEDLENEPFIRNIMPWEQTSGEEKNNKNDGNIGNETVKNRTLTSKIVVPKIEYSQQEEVLESPELETKDDELMVLIKDGNYKEALEYVNKNKIEGNEDVVKLLLTKLMDLEDSIEVKKSDAMPKKEEKAAKVVQKVKKEVPKQEEVSKKEEVKEENYTIQEKIMYAENAFNSYLEAGNFIEALKNLRRYDMLLKANQQGKNLDYAYERIELKKKMMAEGTELYSQKEQIKYRIMLQSTDLEKIKEDINEYKSLGGIIDPLVIIYYADILSENDENSLALSELKAINECHDPHYYEALAKVLFKLKKYQEVLNACINYNSRSILENAKIYIGMAEAYQCLGKPAKALKIYRKLDELNKKGQIDIDVSQKLEKLSRIASQQHEKTLSLINGKSLPI